MSLLELFGGPDEESVEQTFACPPEASGSVTDVVQEVAQTPSGIEVLYQAKPKRLYRLRHTYPPNDPPSTWIEVPSVTTVLKVLDKGGALPWWGQGVGVEAVLTLFEQQRLTYSDGGDKQWLLAPDENRTWKSATKDNVVRLMTEQKMTVNHVVNRAGDRGSSVHKAFETWAETRELPNPDLYPETEAGYVTALVKFLEECKPEPVKSEVMVGSLEHGYAGRFDLLAYQGGYEIVTHLTPKAEKRGVIEPGLGLWDLKTSSSVYPETHYRQLEAYEVASVECGYQPTDFRAVIHCCADGRYQVKESTASFEDFLAVLEVYKSNQRLK